MDSVALLRQQIETAHQFLEGTVADVTSDQAHWGPGSKAIPLGATYAHIVLGEDFFLNRYIGREPLGTGAYAGKIGVSEPPPMGAGWDEWAARVKVDLPALNEYAGAVFKRTVDYVSELKPEDLDREIDLSHTPLGMTTLGAFITLLAVIHPSNHCGEISCLKGLQGAKGYPF